MNKKRKKRVTIYDLATELNVAPSTVSRALQDHYSIGPDTRAAVKELARKRGYRTNTVAASLRTAKSNTIGIMVPWINRPFVSSLISGVEAAAQEAGYNVIISQSNDSYEKEVANVKTLLDSRVHVLLVSLAMETTDYTHLLEVEQAGTPVVYVDRVPTPLQGHRVMIDNFAAAAKATEHLLQQGCRRIALLSGALHQEIYRERRRGYLHALERHGIAVDENLIRVSSRLSVEEGMRIADELLHLGVPPDAIFSTNDGAAVGAIKLARQRGIRIPQELAIMGFNDDPVCEIIEPSLSSVTHPAALMGRQAVLEALRIADPEIETAFLRSSLDTEVVIRASTRRDGVVSATRKGNPWQDEQSIP